MNRLILRLIVTAIALVAAIALVPGIGLVGVGETLSFATLPPIQTIVNLLLIAFIFGLVNAIVRPLLKALTCAITFFTLGLFMFVINALMLLLTTAIAQRFELGLQVDGFIPALLGSIVISVVSTVLSIFVPDKHD